MPPGFRARWQPEMTRLLDPKPVAGSLKYRPGSWDLANPTACRLEPEAWSPTMSSARLHRWDEIALEKVTEMLSRKIVTGEREMLSQIYMKRGCLVPSHSHESEQMTYVLQGALKFLIEGEEITVREGEVLHIPSWVVHQAEALEDTFELDLFSPIRRDWLDHTDDYFHK
jgi:quercetin dioxygenase-like cupin family protein